MPKMPSHATRISAMKVAALVFTLLGWLLLVIALALEDWFSAHGQTTSGVGRLDIKQSIGIFTFKSDECCLVDGQIVSAWGSICNLNTRDKGCTTIDVDAPDYCSYTKARAPTQGNERCEKFEAGAIISITFMIVAILGTTFAAIFLVMRKLGAGKLAIVNSICTLFVVFTIILSRVLMYDVHEYILKARYGSYESSTLPFNVKNAASFGLTVAASILLFISVVIAVIAWWFQRRKAKRVVIEEPVEEKHEPVPPTTMGPEVVMTPERQRRTNSPNRSRPVIVYDDEEDEYEDDGW